MSLFDRIYHKPITNEHIIKEWNNVKDLLEREYVVGYREITPVESEVYKFDLDGLFINVMQISSKFVYPHIIVNGFYCGNQYSGNELIFKLLDIGFLSTYDRLIRKKK